MTGFGKAVQVVSNRKITAEIKSLNSKQLDLSTRLPQPYREIDLELRGNIARQLHRGKVDLFVYSEPIDGAASCSINVDTLKQYKAQILDMSQELGIPQPTDWYATLLRLPDALRNEANSSEATDDEMASVKDVVAQAIDGLVAFRTQEGKRLETFFEEKIAAIQALLDEVPKWEEPRVAKIKARITEQLEKLENVDYDKNRLEQELIFYIEKLDITEEKIRLQNHLNFFLDTLHGDEAQGKKLGFITQEMGREINTLGSKANQAELQKVVVAMKDHLEQIKEQVLNVL